MGEVGFEVCSGFGGDCDAEASIVCRHVFVCVISNENRHRIPELQ